MSNNKEKERNLLKKKLEEVRKLAKDFIDNHSSIELPDVSNKTYKSDAEKKLAAIEYLQLASKKSEVLYQLDQLFPLIDEI